MVSQKSRQKEGILLIRQAVKDGNDVRQSIIAGAGIQIPQSVSPDDHHAYPLPDQPEPHVVVRASAAIIAAKRHIQRISNSCSKSTPSVSEKLNRRLSTFIATCPEIIVPVHTSLTNEFLTGTPIFYRAILVLQSRRKRFLTINEINIDASARTASSSSQFVMINADNLDDDGNVKYGDAVSLVVDNKKALGSKYVGIGSMRILRPALVRCSKGPLQRAHHVGRWILMNRDHPIESLGNHCLHGDKITLEQEWLFLSSSSSSYDVNLYRTKNTIEDLKVDKFNREFTTENFVPTDDCVWKIQLISQKGMDTTDGREFTQLVTKANTQLLKSVKGRNKANKELFGQLSEKVDKNIECDKINDLIKHKLDDKLEYDHFMKLYHNSSLNDFVSPRLINNSTKEAFLKNDDIADIDNKNEHHGHLSPASLLSPKSPSRGNNIDIFSFDNMDTKEFFSPNSTIGSKMKKRNVCYNTINLDSSQDQHLLKLKKIKNDYWNIAQKLLVKSDTWSVSDTAMTKYYNGAKSILQLKSAIIIQRFVRSHCKLLRIVKDRMKEVDQGTIIYLSSCKEEWKEEFKIELDVRKIVEIDREKNFIETASEADMLMNEKLHSSFTHRLLSNVMSHDKVHKKDYHDSNSKGVHPRPETANKGGTNGIKRGATDSNNDHIAIDIVNVKNKNNSKYDNLSSDIESGRPLIRRVRSQTANNGEKRKETFTGTLTGRDYESEKDNSNVKIDESENFTGKVKRKDDVKSSELCTQHIPQELVSVSADYSDSDTIEKMKLKFGHSGVMTGMSKSHSKTTSNAVSHMRSNTSVEMKNNIKFGNYENHLFHETDWNLLFESSKKSDENCSKISDFDKNKTRPKSAFPRLNEQRLQDTGKFVIKHDHNRNIIIQKTESFDKDIEKEEKDRLIRQNQKILKREARLRRSEERKLVQNQLVAKLCFSEKNLFGLPSDVFEKMHEKVSLKTGFNYLLNTSRNRTSTENNFRF